MKKFIIAIEETVVQEFEVMVEDSIEALGIAGQNIAKAN